jgi:hypothetical protein
MDTTTLKGGLVLAATAVVIGLLFVGSYVGALHAPKFHHVPLGVVGDPRLADRLAVGGDFATSTVDSRAAAVRRVYDRNDLGAIVVGRQRIDLLVASAGGRALTAAMETDLPVAVRAATGTNAPIDVVDVRPLPANDPNGLTPFYLVLGIVVASFIGATTFALVFGVKPVGRRVWWRILGFAVVALGLGLGEVGIVNAIGPLRGHYVVLALVGLLLGTTVGAVTVAFQSLLGMYGSGVAILIFVVLGNPASSGPVATKLLPGFWRTIGPYLPSGAGTDLVRNIAYFGGNATTRPLVALFVWLVAALGLAAVAMRVRPIGVPVPADQARPSVGSPATASA